MLNIVVKDITANKKTLGNQTYYLLCNCLNPLTNRIEYDEKAMTIVDIMAFCNLTRSQLNMAFNELYKANAVLNIRLEEKEFYYINPLFACHKTLDISWGSYLVELFCEDANSEPKDMLYYKKGNRKLTINSGGSFIPEDSILAKLKNGGYRGNTRND